MEKTTLKFNSNFDINENGDFNYKLEASGNIFEIFNLVAKARGESEVIRLGIKDDYFFRRNEDGLKNE